MSGILFLSVKSFFRCKRQKLKLGASRKFSLPDKYYQLFQQSVPVWGRNNTSFSLGLPKNPCIFNNRYLYFYKLFCYSVWPSALKNRKLDILSQLNCILSMPVGLGKEIRKELESTLASSMPSQEKILPTTVDMWINSIENTLKINLPYSILKLPLMLRILLPLVHVYQEVLQKKVSTALACRNLKSTHM